MLTLPEIRALLVDRNLSEVSRRSGVPYMALYNIANERAEPKYANVKALVEYLQDKGE